MSPDKLSVDSGSDWMGGAVEPPEIKQRRAVYERPSCIASVSGNMFAIETISLCEPYLQHNKVLVIKCTM